MICILVFISCGSDVNSSSKDGTRNLKAKDNYLEDVVLGQMGDKAVSDVPDWISWNAVNQ
ncbi:MAG: hypothetical protein ABII18_00175 [bacterium]